MAISDRKETLSVQNSLAKAWEGLSGLSKDHAARWHGMKQHVSESVVSVTQLDQDIQHLGNKPVEEVWIEKLSGKIRNHAVKLSGHLLAGTDIAERVMETSVNTLNAAARARDDAEITQNWTDALHFVDVFCLESQERISAARKVCDVVPTAGEQLLSGKASSLESPEDAYHLGFAAGAMETAAHVARQQYERGIRMSLNGPLAEYAAASALENGFTVQPDGPVYGIYRAIHQQHVIVEGIPDGRIINVPVSCEDAAALKNDDSHVRGKPVVYAYDYYLGVGPYRHHDPARFADRCRGRAEDYRATAGHPDGSLYRWHMDESACLSDFADRIERGVCTLQGATSPLNAEEHLSESFALAGVTPESLPLQGEALPFNQDGFFDEKGAQISQDNRCRRIMEDI